MSCLGSCLVAPCLVLALSHDCLGVTWQRTLCQSNDDHSYRESVLGSTSNCLAVINCCNRDIQRRTQFVSLFNMFNAVKFSAGITPWRQLSVLKLFPPSVNAVILVLLWPLCRYPILRGTPSAGAQNTRGGWENFGIFDWNHRLSRKRYNISPWLLRNVNRKS